jgi:hypothetical protein
MLQLVLVNKVPKKKNVYSYVHYLLLHTIWTPKTKMTTEKEKLEKAIADIRSEAIDKFMQSPEAILFANTVSEQLKKSASNFPESSVYETQIRIGSSEIDRMLRNGQKQNILQTALGVTIYYPWIACHTNECSCRWKWDFPRYIGLGWLWDNWTGCVNIALVRLTRE